MSSEPATVHIDGAARGNPGPAAFAFVLAVPGQPPVEVAGRLGKTTNNVAEYTALLRALEAARERGVRRLNVFSDSELLVKQMNGDYRVKNEDLKALYDRARELCAGFDSVTLRHVRRSENRRADELCNLVLDGHWDGSREVPAPAAAAAKPARKGAAPGPVSDARVRGPAVECLAEAAKAWARDGAQAPSPEQVWEQLWDILEEGGVLKRPRRR